jgi:hypothetical protein
MAQLKQWREQNWVRIGTDGSIKGPCGTSKDKKNPDRCLPKRKAQWLSRKRKELVLLEKRKRRELEERQSYANTPRARVRNK